MTTELSSLEINIPDDAGDEEELLDSLKQMKTVIEAQGRQILNLSEKLNRGKHKRSRSKENISPILGEERSRHRDRIDKDTMESYFEKESGVLTKNFEQQLNRMSYKLKKIDFIVKRNENSRCAQIFQKHLLEQKRATFHRWLTWTNKKKAKKAAALNLLMKIQNIQTRKCFLIMQDDLQTKVPVKQQIILLSRKFKKQKNKYKKDLEKVTDIIFSLSDKKVNREEFETLKNNIDKKRIERFFTETKEHINETFKDCLFQINEYNRNTNRELQNCKNYVLSKADDSQINKLNSQLEEAESNLKNIFHQMEYLRESVRRIEAESGQYEDIINLLTENHYTTEKVIQEQYSLKNEQDIISGKIRKIREYQMYLFRNRESMGIGSGSGIISSISCFGEEKEGSKSIRDRDREQVDIRDPHAHNEQLGYEETRAPAVRNMNMNTNMNNHNKEEKGRRNPDLVEVLSPPRLGSPQGSPPQGESKNISPGPRTPPHRADTAEYPVPAVPKLVRVHMRGAARSLPGGKDAFPSFPISEPGTQPLTAHSATSPSGLSPIQTLSLKQTGEIEELKTFDVDPRAERESHPRMHPMISSAQQRITHERQTSMAGINRPHTQQAPNFHIAPSFTPAPFRRCIPQVQVPVLPQQPPPVNIKAATSSQNTRRTTSYNTYLNSTNIGKVRPGTAQGVLYAGLGERITQVKVRNIGFLYPGESPEPAIANIHPHRAHPRSKSNFTAGGRGRDGKKLGTLKAYDTESKLFGGGADTMADTSYEGYNTSLPVGGTQQIFDDTLRQYANTSYAGLRSIRK